MTNIEDLRSRLKVLSGLLEKPEPGLSTWHECYERAAANVLSFWGYGVANVLLLPAATQEPAGSKRCDECEWHGCAGREHGCGCKCHIMEMIAGQAKLEGVEREPAGSGASEPTRGSIEWLRRLHEPPATAVPEELWQVIKRLYEKFHHGGFTNWPAIANRLTVWLAAGSPRKVGEDWALRKALALHICQCDQPYHGAQPVGVFKCERCGKCCDEKLRALSLSSPIEPPSVEHGVTVDYVAGQEREAANARLVARETGSTRARLYNPR